MEDFELFKKRVEIERTADNTKMFVVGVLIFSLFVFKAIGDEASKGIVLYWAGFMLALVGVCAVQDIRNAKKIKALKSSKKGK